MTLRFDGRVAIVTGAGRGIGAAYARLLAARGGSVVVNDLGASIGGTGSDAAPAAAVVDEIVGAGGDAVADHHDVADADGARALVAAAVDRYGRIDAVIANAGIMRWAGPPDVTADDLARHLAVHVGGSFHLALAAWVHLTEHGAGRVVLTTSTGVLGLPANTAYAAAKGGVLGLTRSLATAGTAHGIKVNAIAPAAMTRMAGPGEPTPQSAPELVAPMAAYLAHEGCPVTGEVYVAGFGRFARLFVATTDGFVADAAPTIEDVAAHWAEINDETGYAVPADLPAWSASFLRHLEANP